jgi:hypothetical protein
LVVMAVVFIRGQRTFAENIKISILIVYSIAARSYIMVLFSIIYDGGAPCAVI